jgi:TolA-binding protein
MEFLSFALGMVTVVVITMVVVAVVAFVKAKKNEKNLEDFMNSISHEISHIQDTLNKRLDDLEREIYLQMELNHKELDSDISKRTEQLHRRIDEFQSQIDSRLDKTYDANKSKFSNLENYVENLMKIIENKVKENNNNKILLKD